MSRLSRTTPRPTGVATGALIVKLGKISALALSHMKRRGITIAALDDLIAHGQVETQLDGAQIVYLDAPVPAPAWSGRPQPRLYAVMDAAGEVLTLEKRVRRRDAAIDRARRAG